MKFQLIGYIHHEGMLPIFYSPIIDTHYDMDGDIINIINEYLQDNPKILHQFIAPIRAKILGKRPFVTNPLKILMDQFNLQVYAIKGEKQNLEEPEFAIPIPLEEFLPEEMTLDEVLGKIQNIRNSIEERISKFLKATEDINEDIMPVSIDFEEDVIYVSYAEALDLNRMKRLGLSPANYSVKDDDTFSYYLPFV